MTKVIATILAIFVVGPLLFIEQGWAISTLWNWFVAPLGAPQIGIATAIGISLTVAVIRMKGSAKSPERTRRQSIENLAGIFLVPLVGVGLGWIVKQYV